MSNKQIINSNITKSKVDIRQQNKAIQDLIDKKSVKYTNYDAETDTEEEKDYVDGDGVTKTYISWVLDKLSDGEQHSVMSLQIDANNRDRGRRATIATVTRLRRQRHNIKTIMKDKEVLYYQLVQ